MTTEREQPIPCTEEGSVEERSTIGVGLVSFAIDAYYSGAPSPS